MQKVTKTLTLGAADVKVSGDSDRWAHKMLWLVLSPSSFLCRQAFFYCRRTLLKQFSLSPGCRQAAFTVARLSPSNFIVAGLYSSSFLCRQVVAKQFSLSPGCRQAIFTVANPLAEEWRNRFSLHILLVAGVFKFQNFLRGFAPEPR